MNKEKGSLKRPKKKKSSNNNWSTPAKHHRKDHGPTPTHPSKGWMGSLAFYPYEAVMSCPYIPARELSKKAIGSWDFYLGS